MNYVAEEIKSYIGIHEDQDDLMHYGMPRRSGRYPWGSGKEPFQHSGDFMSRVEQLRSEFPSWTDPETGKKYTGDTAVAQIMGMPTTDLRRQIGYAEDLRKLETIKKIESMRKDGLGATAIGRKLDPPLSESTVRSLMNAKVKENAEKAQITADFLKQHVDEKGMIDIGGNIPQELGVSKEKLNQALLILEQQDYVIYGAGVPQVTNKGKQTNLLVLCKPGTEHKEIYNYENIGYINDYTTRDGGQTFEKKFHYPTSIDSSRVKILLHDEIGPDGEPGVAKDGVIQIRPGVPDLSLGNSHYAQVRILVDNNKYLKGMAVYSNNLPDGIDVLFNSNKKTVEDGYKPIKDDSDNPFGSLIKDCDKGGQYWYDDPVTGEKKLGAINKKSDEGDWADWADKLPTQFLSKQPKSLIKRQIDIAVQDKQDEFDSIMALTNPTVKKKMLQSFADDCDSTAVHLKVAALPGQKYHVILPVNAVKETEIYAPNYEDGTKVALVRYPHGGIFEIPILTVNNKNKVARELFGTEIRDAVCINKKNAEILSGADFDGDTVMVIPTGTNGIDIKNRKLLKGLEGFEPKESYPYREGMKLMKDKERGTDATQAEMGKITNLITDMTLQDANDDDLAKAVRHSMVVIDAGKHMLDYKRSEIENDIAALKQKYQGGNGAGTLISRAKGQKTVDRRQGTPKTNVKYNSKGELNDFYDPTKPEGSLIYTTADDLYYPNREYDKKSKNVTLRTTDGKRIIYNIEDKELHDKYNPIKVVDKETGKVKFTNKRGDIEYKVKKKTQATTNMADAYDAYDLVSDLKHPKEILYADFANTMKDMANKARIEITKTPRLEMSKDAKVKYANEVASLDKKLRESQANAPRERQAQIIANSIVKAKQQDNPDMDNSSLKKAKQQALTAARAQVGAKRVTISIEDKEWEAIQAGAISENKLKQILNRADEGRVRELATPRDKQGLTTAQITRIENLLNNSGRKRNSFTTAEIAEAIGVSVSTINKYKAKLNI